MCLFAFGKLFCDFITIFRRRFLVNFCHMTRSNLKVALFSTYTRSTHAYDASRRSKRHARMGRAAQVSGVARLV